MNKTIGDLVEVLLLQLDNVSVAVDKDENGGLVLCVNKNGEEYIRPISISFSMSEYEELVNEIIKWFKQ